MTVTDYGEIVAALRAVPGVSEADVRPDTEGGLGLLRLGLDPGVDEVQVATSVGRLLRDRFGIGVDADRVQLVEDTGETGGEEGIGPLAGRGGSGPLGRHGRRATIQRLQLVSSGLDVTAQVTLGLAGRTVVGRTVGSASPSGVQRSVATAALQAAAELAGPDVRFDLDHVEVTASGRERTVLVTVTMLSETGSERLTGAAVVREDVRQACVRAALDAVNRRLERLFA